MKSAIRGALLTFKQDPFFYDIQDAICYESDVVVVMEEGKVSQVGTAKQILPNLQNVPVETYPNCLILAGFIDSHVHYAQTQMIAAYGEQLLDWLNEYTFKTEQCFADKNHAREIAQIFIREQLRNGVTTSAVYCTVFPQSVDALFAEAAKYNMRMLAGKVCMDRHAPTELLDTPERAYEESRQLISKWHGKDRLEYVITPRFPATSTPAQLEAIAALATEYPQMPIQSHIAENLSEIAWVKSLYPQAKDYTDVYAHYGLLRDRAIYGHGIHLTEHELGVFSETGAAIAHCPTSNFFLGSGCLNIRKLKDPKRPVRVGLATDIGAGTSFSMLQTMNEAYKAAQLNGMPYGAVQSFYLASRGAAEALGLADKIGSIEIGMEADLTVLNLKSTPFIEYRMRYADSLEEALFIQIILGDDRAVEATYVGGERIKVQKFI